MLFATPARVTVNQSSSVAFRRVFLFGLYFSTWLKLRPVTKAISTGRFPFIVKTMNLSDFFIREFASPRAHAVVFFSFRLDFRRQDVARIQQRLMENSDTAWKQIHPSPTCISSYFAVYHRSGFFSTQSRILFCSSGFFHGFGMCVSFCVRARFLTPPESIKR